MSGNQDTAAGAGDRVASARARALVVCERLHAQLDRAVQAIEACELEPQAPLTVQRFVRAIELTARAALTLEKMAVGKAAKARREDDQTEQDVSKADRDDSPENLQRIRDELMDDFDRIHALLEQKELAGRPDAEGASRAEGAPALAA